MKAPYVLLLGVAGCGAFAGPQLPPTRLDIRDTSITIVEGRQRTVSLDIDRCLSLNYCVLWWSSNECVASGVANVVYGLESGSAMLHVVASEATALRDSVRVTVTPVTVTAMQLDLDSIALTVGLDQSVVVRFYDAVRYAIQRAAVFQSNDTSVAMVTTVPVCAATAYVNIRAVHPGRTVVTARFGSLVDSVRVNVR